MLCFNSEQAMYFTSPSLAIIITLITIINSQTTLGSTVISHKDPVEVRYALAQASLFTNDISLTSEAVSEGALYSGGINILCVATENLVQKTLSDIINTRLSEKEKITTLEWYYGVFSTLKLEFINNNQFTTAELRDGEFTEHNFSFFSQLFKKY